MPRPRTRQAWPAVLNVGLLLTALLLGAGPVGSVGAGHQAVDLQAVRLAGDTHTAAPTPGTRDTDTDNDDDDDKGDDPAPDRTAPAPSEDMSGALTAALAREQSATAALAAARAAVAAAHANLLAARARQARLVAQIADLDRETRTLQNRLDVVTRDIAHGRAAISGIVRTMYADSGLAQVAFYLGANSPRDLTDAVAYGQYAADNQAAAVAAFSATRDRLDIATRALAAHRTRVAALHARADRTATRMAALQASATATAGTIAGQAAAASRAATAARAAAGLEAERVAVAVAAGSASAHAVLAEAAAVHLSGAAAGTGQLTWPVGAPSRDHGDVGPRTNPVTGSLSCHSGIDIGAARGTPLLAAAPGIVVSTATNEWDGNVTVVAHAGGMTTWYAHQDTFGVTVGERVRRGQVIGWVGSTGFATGPHLHFDVMLGDVLWDPAGWFDRPMRPVAALCSAPYPTPTP